MTEKSLAMADIERYDSVETCRNGSDTLTLTDPEILDCPICCGFLNLPVYECENRHMVCSPCCTKLMRICPFCRSRMIYRSRAIEKVIESVKVSCRNRKYGCEETMSYAKRDEHDKTCLFAQCKCPHRGCNFQGKDSILYRHYYITHSNPVKRFRFNNSIAVTATLNNHIKYLILQEEEGKQLFILKNIPDRLGCLLSLSLISSPGCTDYFHYDIQAEHGETSYRFKSCTNNIQDVAGNHPSMGFHLIPSKFFGSNGLLKVGICIRTHSASPPKLKD